MGKEGELHLKDKNHVHLTRRKHKQVSPVSHEAESHLRNVSDRLEGWGTQKKFLVKGTAGNTGAKGKVAPGGICVVQMAL